jgi:serine O-acetyltransferase
LPSTCKIGTGFCLLHGGTVVINSGSEIGVNCTISHGVTIGHTLGGKHPGVPRIGNRVFVGPERCFSAGSRWGTMPRLAQTPS